MAISPVRLAQNKFLMNGGGYELALAQMREKGTMAMDYEYNEYPKSLRISHGMGEAVERETDTCKGTTIRWTEKAREVFEDIIVNSEEEEERVLSGGKTSAQIEEDRRGLISRCHTMGIPCDPSWSAVRLRRTLGDALDAPAPGDSMAKLEIELAGLRKMAAMQAEIEQLRAQMAAQSAHDEPIEELGDVKGKRAKVAA
jgi:hypothetical protein